VTVLIDDIRGSDQTGRTLMRLRGPRGGTYLYTAFLYDDFSRMIQVRQPNYYAPPNGSAAATWVISMTYTYLGLLASRTTPDSGPTQFLYDSANRLRFTMDPGQRWQTTSNFLR
jgi:YD repeat-containing protein